MSGIKLEIKHSLDNQPAHAVTHGDDVFDSRTETVRPAQSQSTPNPEPASKSTRNVALPSMPRPSTSGSWIAKYGSKLTMPALTSVSEQSSTSSSIQPPGASVRVKARKLSETELEQRENSAAAIGKS